MLLILLLFSSILFSQQYGRVGFPISNNKQYFDNNTMLYNMPFYGFVVFQEGDSKIFVKDFHANQDIRIPDSARLLGIYKKSTVEWGVEKTINYEYVLFGPIKVHYDFVVKARAYKQPVSINGKNP